jgi:tetratricopeptide (TPR) repeat protein
MIPIDESTLVYGSRDGGRSLVCTDPELIRRVKRVAKHLNLASHVVWDEEMNESMKAYTPVDCEGHLGSDGRLYLIDPARRSLFQSINNANFSNLAYRAVFPPEPPAPAIRGARLFRLLRPELVRLSRRALCSDAFSRFQVEGMENFNRDVQMAHHLLINVVIPEFSAWLSDRYSAVDQDSNMPPIYLRDVVEIEVEAHRRGINFRYLGLVRQGILESDSPRARAAIATAIAARVIKNVIRTHSRAVKATSEASFRKLLVTYFNLIFAPTDDAKCSEFWNKHLKDRIEKSFPSTLSATSETVLRRGEFVHERALLDRINSMMGISLNQSKLPELEAAKVECGRTLTEADVLEIAAVVRTSNRVSLDQATAIVKKSLASTSSMCARFQCTDCFPGEWLIFFSRTETRKLLQEAEDNFKLAIELKPGDIRAIQNWALSLAIQASRLERSNSITEEESEQMYSSAIEKLQSAVTVDKTDGRTHVIWGNLLFEMGMGSLTCLCEYRYLISCVLSASSTQRARPSRLRLIKEACEHYHVATSALRDSLRASILNDCFFNWGQCLLLQAELASSKPSRIESLRAARSVYSMADTFKSKQANAVVIAKLGWIAEDLEILSEAVQLFEQSLQASPNDSALHYNAGNAFFKLSRLFSIRGNPIKSFESCSAAIEQYISSIELLPSFASPLYNWGATILFIVTKLDGSQWSTPEFEFGVKMYFQMFSQLCHSLRHRGASIAPNISILLSLIRQHNSDIVSALSYRCLEEISRSESASNSVKSEITQMLKSLQSSSRVKQLLSDTIPSMSGLSDASSLVLTGFVLGAGVTSSPTDTVTQEDEATMSLRDFEIIESYSAVQRNRPQTSLHDGSGVFSVRRTKRGRRQNFLLECQSLETSCNILVGKLLTDFKNVVDARQALHFHLTKVKDSVGEQFALRGHFFSSPQEISIPGEEGDNGLVACLLHSVPHNPGFFWKRVRELSSSRQISPSDFTSMVRWYAAQMYALVRRVHQKSWVVKRPLDPSEILMSKDGYILPLCVPSIESSSVSEADVAAFPAQLLAPEVLTAQRPFTAAADWFSYGWFLYALATGQTINSSRQGGGRFNQLYHSILVGQVAKVAEAKLPDPSLSALIQGLLQRDPDARLRVAQSLPEHSFFASLDWESIESRRAVAPIVFSSREDADQPMETAATVVDEPIKFPFRGNSISSS